MRTRRAFRPALDDRLEARLVLSTAAAHVHALAAHGHPHANSVSAHNGHATTIHPRQSSVAVGVVALPTSGFNSANIGPAFGVVINTVTATPSNGQINVGLTNAFVVPTFVNSIEGGFSTINTTVTFTSDGLINSLTTITNPFVTTSVNNQFNTNTNESSSVTSVSFTNINPDGTP
jgi:hypothetical protein